MPSDNNLKPSKHSCQPKHEQAFLLPELCRPEALLGLILLAELLVLLLVLAEPAANGFDWYRLALTSMFVQWVVLLSAASLCASRHLLAQVSPVKTSLLACIIVAALTLLCSLAVHMLHKSYPGPALGLNQHNITIFYWRNLLISLIVSGLTMRFFYLQSESKRQQQANLHAQLHALQARIEPHFLFNSLNSIASLIVIDSDKAEQALLDLSDLFRAALSHDSGISNWQHERQLAEKYLSIERYRLAERLQVSWSCLGIDKDTPMPHLCLQPLLENAIKHGIQPSAAGGLISIQARLENNQVKLSVHNPVSASILTRPGAGIALDNITTRLKALFGSQAKLQTESNATNFTVSISYPLPSKKE